MNAVINWDRGSAEMERTVQTRSYQDPLEGAFEKLVTWTFIFTSDDEHAPVHVLCDDFSGRQFALPVGAFLEMAEVLRKAQVANQPTV